MKISDAIICLWNQRTVYGNRITEIYNGVVYSAMTEIVSQGGQKYGVQHG